MGPSQGRRTDQIPPTGDTWRTHSTLKTAVPVTLAVMNTMACWGTARPSATPAEPLSSDWSLSFYFVRCSPPAAVNRKLRKNTEKTSTLAKCLLPRLADARHRQQRQRHCSRSWVEHTQNFCEMMLADAVCVCCRVGSWWRPATASCRALLREAGRPHWLVTVSGFYTPETNGRHGACQQQEGKVFEKSQHTGRVQQTSDPELWPPEKLLPLPLLFRLLLRGCAATLPNIQGSCPP